MGTTRSTRTSGAGVAALLVGVAGLGLAACGSGDSSASPGSPTVPFVNAQSAGSEPAPPAITATGTGQASANPDTMVVSIDVRTDGDTAAQTLDENSLRTQQLLDTARSQGVAEADLRTTNVSVFPRFDENGRRVVGYSADNSFTVTYRDLATAGGLLDALLDVGGDFAQLQGISLGIDDPTEVLAAARADAVERARTQAEQLAEAAGVTLGAVRTITELTPQTFTYDSDGFAAGAADSARVAVPIAGGEQDVSVQVEVVFDIAS